MKLSGPSKKVVVIFFLTLVCAYISLSPGFNLLGRSFSLPGLDVKIGSLEIKRSFNLVLGLDLAGGSHLVFEADTSHLSSGDKKDALESVKSIFEQRVNFMGVSEPNIQLSSFEGKDRIIVELPGIKDTQTAVSLIGKTARLDFREFIDEKSATQGATLLNTKPTGFTGADFKKATPGFDQQLSKPIISFETKPESANKFGEITTKLVGKYLIVFLDDAVLSIATVQEPITQGRGQISGAFTVEQTKLLSKLMNAGALPVGVNLVQEQTIGATLGAESISRSVRAGLVGLGMVLLFMFLAYGKLGLIADVGLIIYGVLTLALYKFIPVVLTLPGIAGFLLSVGMAVDSNILIFERFKEEKPRRPLADALEVSFGRAWDSIRDANIATLMTAFVLANPFDWSFLNTSGPVRGFAITLALGIGLSLFTGIIVVRNLLRVFIRK